MVKRQAWSDTVSLLLRFGEACDKGGAHSSQAKAYLGAIVVWLHAGNVQQAWQVRDCFVTVLRRDMCLDLGCLPASGVDPCVCGCGCWP